MGRIRTIKPEFFRHLELYRAEKETGLPLRIAYAGLWCVADREGRFKWQPEVLRLDVLPFDDVDFARVLHALATRGFIVKYTCSGRLYGFIPTFKEHQVINHRERQSVLPDPEECEIIFEENSDTSTREPRVSHASSTPARACTGTHGHARGERERELEGEREPPPPIIPPPPTSGGGRVVVSSPSSKPALTAKQQAMFDKFWQAYPRKVAKGKAEKAWKSIRVDEALLGVMLAKIEEAKATEAWRKDGGQFIPHPATWLNAKRWLDDLGGCDLESRQRVIESAISILHFDGRESFLAFCAEKNLNPAEVEQWSTKFLRPN